MPDLPHELQEMSQMSAANLKKWMRVYEEWTLTLANISPDRWKDYFGKGQEMKWIWAEVCDNRSGPVAGIQVAPNLNLAGRAAETIVKIVQHATPFRTRKVLVGTMLSKSY